jgi:DNA-binding IclR family transcriptional regulator
VFDHYGDVTAALTVLGPDRYLTSSRLKSCIADLLQMAAGLSRAIGAPEPGPGSPAKKLSRPT